MSQDPFENRLLTIQSYADDEPDRALADVDMLIAEGCDSTLAYMLKALLHYDKDDYAAAVGAFQRVLADQPANDVASISLFHSLWQLGEKDAALAEQKRFRAAAGRDDWRLPDDIEAEKFPRTR